MREEKVTVVTYYLLHFLLLLGCYCCRAAAAAAAAVGQLQVAYSLLLKLLLRLWCGQSRPQVSRWNKKKHRTEFLQ
jgi:hypothetical protein